MQVYSKCSDFCDGRGREFHIYGSQMLQFLPPTSSYALSQLIAVRPAVGSEIQYL